VGTVYPATHRGPDQVNVFTYLQLLRFTVLPVEAITLTQSRSIKHSPICCPYFAWGVDVWSLVFLWFVWNLSSPFSKISLRGARAKCRYRCFQTSAIIIITFTWSGPSGVLGCTGQRP
jgi:hypothetical protein